jgi:hypothetical protein
MIRRILVVLSIVLLIVGFFVPSPWNSALIIMAIASLIAILLVSLTAMCP